MLPFLKPKQSSVAGLIIKNRAPDKSNENEELEPSAEKCAQALLTAIQNQDKAGIVEAIKGIMTEKSEASPHSYDAQNQAAAKGEE